MRRSAVRIEGGQQLRVRPTGSAVVRMAEWMERQRLRLLPQRRRDVVEVDVRRRAQVSGSARMG